MKIRMFEHRYSIVLQFILTLAIVVIGILSFIKNGIFTNIFYLLVGCDLLVIGYNNKKVFKKEQYNIVYIVVAVIILLFSIYSFLNYFKVI